MIKLKHTGEIKNVSIEGQQFCVDKDGTVDVPAEFAERLIPFGFQLHVQDEKKPLKKITDK